METLVVMLLRTVVAGIRMLPLGLVARMGRAAGGAAWALDRRHRRVARRNMEAVFGGERTPRELDALVRENFRRIGEAYACAIKTSGMSDEELRPHLRIEGLERMIPGCSELSATSRVVAIGHFGNFELYTRFSTAFDGYHGASTYRALRPPALDRVVLELRERSGCRFFERRRDMKRLQQAMAEEHLLLGLLVDQHAGDSGLRLPFLGRDASCSASAAVFAQRYRCPLHTAICYRTAPGRWRIEVGPEIPILENGHLRDRAAIVGDINRAFETGIRRDPANWFWVHNRWKPARRPAVLPKGES